MFFIQLIIYFSLLYSFILCEIHIKIKGEGVNILFVGMSNSKEMCVTKRSGELQEIAFDKILTRVKKLGKEEWVSYISTGGGALLESLEGKVLPGVFALTDEYN